MKKPIQEIAYFLKSLKGYARFVEYSDRLWPEELVRYEASLSSGDDDRFGLHRNLWHALSDEFPQLQRKSYLIMLMALFEDFLNQLCCSLREHENIAEKLEDFNVRSRGIERAKEYIKAYSRMSFPSGTGEWERVKRAQAIRNIIVHAAGHIDSIKHAKQLEIVNTNQELDKGDFARTHLIIGSKYLSELVSDIEVFCKKLLATLSF